MATVADLWESEAPAKSGGSSTMPAKKSFSTYKDGIVINEPQQSEGKTVADLWETTPQQTSTQTAKQPQTSFVTDALNKALQLRQQMPGFAASALDVVANAPSALAQTIGYGAGRAFGLSPEEAARSAGKLSSQLAVPVGRLTGTAQTPEYQKALPTQAMEKIGQVVQERVVQPIAQRTGASPLDVEQGVNAAMMALPFGVKPVARGIAEAKAALPTIRIEKTPQQLAADMAKPASPGSVGAAKTEFNPYAGQITGEESARGQFPQVKLSKMTQDAAPQEQLTRAQIASEILSEGGVDASQIRQGVITGNENTLRNEHAKAKMANPTPEGELYKQQIANEQTALSNYAKQRIDKTGASQTLVTPYERGERINSAFTGDEGLTGFFKQEKKSLYDEANNRTGGNPIQSNNVENLFSNKQFKAGLGLKGNEGVARSAEELINLAKTTGFEDEMGNVHAPNTVGAWTAVQKALNKDWTPQNAGVIRKINQAIERDIGQAGGLDLLKKADQLHEAEKVLFGSKGIKQIFGDIDPNGVQTATAFEAIPQKLNSMPVDQWKHIYETAEKVAKGTIDGPIDKATGMPKWSIKVPDELRTSAQSAMNEMRGNIAREIYQAGAAKAGEWNQNAVNTILNARADKIKFAFSPEEQKAFHTLNVGGYLMPGIHGYEGGGQQLRRVGLIEGNLGKAGTGAGAAAGTALFGPGVGTAVGGYIGGKAGVAGSEALAARALKKQAEKSKAEMQKAAKLGNKLSDIGKE